MPFSDTLFPFFTYYYFDNIVVSLFLLVDLNSTPSTHLPLKAYFGKY